MGNVMTTPLLYLYLNGPRALGGWEGMDEPTVCSALTNADPLLWTLQKNECHAILVRKCHAYATVLYALLGGLVVYHSSTCVLQACARYVTTGSLLPSFPALEAGAEHGHWLVCAPRLHLPGLHVRRAALHTGEETFAG
jgi:hypothetical protein